MTKQSHLIYFKDITAANEEKKRKQELDQYLNEIFARFQMDYQLVNPSKRSNELN